MVSNFHKFFFFMIIFSVFASAPQAIKFLIIIPKVWDRDTKKAWNRLYYS